MPVFMYDSTNAADIPSNAALILVYIDGAYKTDVSVRQRFPNAQLVTVTTSPIGSLSAQVYDCEPGNGTANQSAQWARNKIARGERPCIYCSRVGSPNYGWSWVKQALGPDLSKVDFGIADYTGQPHLIPGSVFTQYVTYPVQNYDVSMTNGVWPNTIPDLLGKDNDDVGITELANGQVLISAASPNDHLLVFKFNPAEWPNLGTSVVDVSLQIGNQNNGGLFLVQ
jgi:hypothetical protein